MKLNYHPPHLMLIHFPTALFPMELVCAFLGLYLADATFHYAAFYALAGGVTMGWLAVLFGFYDLVHIPETKTEARRTALIHGMLNIVVLSAYTVLFFMQWKAPEISASGGWLLALKGLLVVVLIGGNYLGAQLVLKYKIGTIQNEIT